MNNNYLSRGFLLFSLYSLFRLANTITRFTPSQFTNLIHDTRELIIAFNRLRTRCSTARVLHASLLHIPLW